MDDFDRALSAHNFEREDGKELIVDPPDDDDSEEVDEALRKINEMLESPTNSMELASSFVAKPLVQPQPQGSASEDDDYDDGQFEDEDEETKNGTISKEAIQVENGNKEETFFVDASSGSLSIQSETFTIDNLKPESPLPSLKFPPSDSNKTAHAPKPEVVRVEKLSKSFDLNHSQESSKNLDLESKQKTTIGGSLSSSEDQAIITSNAVEQSPEVRTSSPGKLSASSQNGTDNRKNMISPSGVLSRDTPSSVLSQQSVDQRQLSASPLRSRQGDSECSGSPTLPRSQLIKKIQSRSRSPVHHQTSPTKHSPKQQSTSQLQLNASVPEAVVETSPQKRCPLRRSIRSAPNAAHTLATKSAAKYRPSKDKTSFVTKSTSGSKPAPTQAGRSSKASLKQKSRNRSSVTMSVSKKVRRKRDVQEDVFKGIMITSENFLGGKEQIRDTGAHKLFEHELAELQRRAEADKKTIADLREESALLTKKVHTNQEKWQETKIKLDQVTKKKLQLEKERDRDAQDAPRCSVLQQDISTLKSTLSKKEAEIYQLKVQVEKEKSATSFRDMLKKGNDIKEISTTEAEALVKELKQLSHLFEMANKENEVLSKKLKTKEADMQLERTASYEKIRELSRDLDAVTKENDDFRLGTLRQSHPEAHSALKFKEKKIRELETKLKTWAHEKKVEHDRLLTKIETLNEQVRENRAQRKKVKNKQVQELKMELEIVKREKNRDIKELQEKQKWYIQNQESIDKLNKKNKDLKEKIDELNREIVRLKQESDIAKRTRLLRSKTGSKAEIQKLKRKIETLQGIIDGKNPDCLANLIRATEPNTNRPNVWRLQRQIEKLQVQLGEQEEDQQRQLRIAKQATDKIIEELRARNRKLQQRLKGIKVKAVSVREQELEKQIEEIREHYTKKVKTLQWKLKDAVKSPAKRNWKVEESAWAAENKHMRKEIAETKNTQDGKLSAAVEEAKLLATELQEGKEKIKKLRKEIIEHRTIEGDLKLRIQVLEKKIMDMPPPAPPPPETCDRGTVTIKSIPQATCKTPSVAEHEEAQRRMETAIVGELRNMLEWERVERAKLEIRIQELTFELSTVKSKPGFIQFQSVLSKIEAVEQRAADRERELQNTIRDLQNKQCARIPGSNYYNTKLLGYRKEIDELINEFGALL